MECLMQTEEEMKNDHRFFGKVRVIEEKERKHNRKKLAFSSSDRREKYESKTPVPSAKSSTSKSNSPMVEKLCHWLSNLKAIAFIHNNIAMSIDFCIDIVRNCFINEFTQEANLPFPDPESLGVTNNKKCLDTGAETSNTEITYFDIQALQIFSSYSIVHLKSIHKLLRHVKFLGLDYDCGDMSALREFQHVLLNECQLIHLSITGKSLQETNRKKERDENTHYLFSFFFF
ncbi:hypothetical protein RFI_09173 [Reticulomyxa filosa]|uniref:Uncharacterized protein n=1 Tax=Reticulomyxa filosa TaxID=46433 RepID=X6NPM8_RETFI|nr:hypothetical protein RFI_09173 [Reticulomyxa filosa]|eukprot:ETO27951.1 hypothetical protein RFI_09173 [Reticulomyxa filosa]